MLNQLDAPTQGDYQKALMSQDACNLSGIVFEFAKVMERICAQAHAERLGTEWKNTHAICRLYAEQIYFLASGKEWKEAYIECFKKANAVEEETHAHVS